VITRGETLAYPGCGGRWTSAAGIAVLGLALVAPAPRSAIAGDLGDNGVRLNFGLGGGDRWVAGRSGPVLPAELTLTYIPLVSVSAGMVAGDGGIDQAYGELCFHLIASVGAGVGYGAYESDQGRRSGAAVHRRSQGLTSLKSRLRHQQKH
jgi:hypothetical protein